MAQQLKTTTRGSTVVEGLAVMLALAAVVSGILLVLYLSFTRVWVKSSLYDGLICVQEHRNLNECQELVRERLRFLPWGSTNKLRLEKNGEGSVSIRIRNGLTLDVSQSLPENLK